MILPQLTQHWEYKWTPHTQCPMIFLTEKMKRFQRWPKLTFCSNLSFHKSPSCSALCSNLAYKEEHSRSFFRVMNSKTFIPLNESGSPSILLKLGKSYQNTNENCYFLSSVLGPEVCVLSFSMLPLWNPTMFPYWWNSMIQKLLCSLNSKKQPLSHGKSSWSTLINLSLSDILDTECFEKIFTL